MNRTQPGGRVVGIDVIPAQPPRGVSTLQGDFLSAEIREEVRAFVLDEERGRVRSKATIGRAEEDEEGITEEELEEQGKGVLERERGRETLEGTETNAAGRKTTEATSQKDKDKLEGRVVNVVLSDMSEPWPLTASTWIRSVSNPHRRMMNTSGMAFRDHAGSMVRCQCIHLL